MHLPILKFWKESSEIIGLSATKTSLLWNKKYQLDSQNKLEWQMAILFFRLYRSLGSIVGSAESARSWLRGPNTELASPVNEILVCFIALIQSGVLLYLTIKR